VPKKIVVMTTDADADGSVECPIPWAKVEQVAGDVGYFSGEEDRALAKWLLRMSFIVRKPRG
jgi:hypothetical protein